MIEFFFGTVAHVCASPWFFQSSGRLVIRRKKINEILLSREISSSMKKNDEIKPYILQIAWGYILIAELSDDIIIILEELEYHSIKYHSKVFNIFHATILIVGFCVGAYHSKTLLCLAALMLCCGWEYKLCI